MEWLGVPILLIMNWVYRHVGNYGVAIILLTVVSKVLFYPLTVKSMRSMKAMQALQPQINALRNKYKSDPQRLQRETMELYRQHKVNPMGGCLPMVAQIPIFYALYLALSVSVELQNATFLCIGHLFGLHLWICDLASHDPTYVLPILMGVTMFVQQKMTPTAGDPRQAKMMLVMPFIFTFMFLNLPAGLVLYWTVSNVLQILQQKFMDRHHKAYATQGKPAEPDQRPDPDSPNSPPVRLSSALEALLTEGSSSNPRSAPVGARDRGVRSVSGAPDRKWQRVQRLVGSIEPEVAHRERHPGQPPVPASAARQRRSRSRISGLGPDFLEFRSRS